MAEQKFLASEKAMEQLDSASVQEVHENEWLKHEAMVHRYKLIDFCCRFGAKQVFLYRVSNFGLLKVTFTTCFLQKNSSERIFNIFTVNLPI